ncbi:MAG: rhomboid family intramembrane serine protease [Sphaerochaetaceae bacterium]|nr:rhomboid family intramembrane serine protease [Sphaerochaetaceae bacterium]
MANNVLNKKFRYVYFNATLYIIGLNLLVYLFLHFTDIRINNMPLVYWLSLVPAWMDKFYIWQYFTYMFVHQDFFHILFNMYVLFMFGTMLERSLGSYEFICFYVVCGVLGGLVGGVVYRLTGMANIVVYGASGAVYALMFLASVMAPNTRVLLFFFIPIRLGMVILIFMAIELVGVLTQASGVSYVVHLSSMVIAWIYCLARFRISPFKVWKSLFRR